MSSKAERAAITSLVLLVPLGIGIVVSTWTMSPAVLAPVGPGSVPSGCTSASAVASASASASGSAGCDVVLVAGAFERTFQPSGSETYCAGALRFRGDMEYADIAATMPSSCTKHPGVGGARLRCPGVSLVFAGPVWFLAHVVVAASASAGASGSPSASTSGPPASP